MHPFLSGDTVSDIEAVLAVAAVDVADHTIAIPHNSDVDPIAGLDNTVY